MIRNAIHVTVVGGVYQETVLWPPKNEIYGSAGRAACAMAQLGAAVRLTAYVDHATADVVDGLASVYQFAWEPAPTDQRIAFFYIYGTATPDFDRPTKQLPVLRVKDDCVVRYGMLEATAIVDAQWAVYDPQDSHAPAWFTANGSRADHLAIVLNEREAATLVGHHDSPIDMAAEIARRDKAEIVVLKRGPKGALVWFKGTVTEVSAYETDRVFKVGSGDYFVAHFAYRWMVERRAPAEAALLASQATAAYCNSGVFPTHDDLEAFTATPLRLGQRWLEGYEPNVYLAGPFFSLGQLWIVEQARRGLYEMGLKVFSPYHEIGLGDAEHVVPLDLAAIRDCDVMFAIVDGLDAGTVYEIGYARALGKPVIVYCESEAPEPLKMMTGSDCFVVPDFVSALYKTSWVAISQ
jgi:nucleoside 2-deoxyribosyltransferase